MKKRSVFIFLLLVVMIFTSCAQNTDPFATKTPDETKSPEENSERPSQTIRVISYNLDANEETINKRAEGMANIILSLQPDSFGVQEARGSWVQHIEKYFMKSNGRRDSNVKKDFMKDYGRVGVDAGGNEDASYGYFATYIFYRLDKYRVVDSGTFWMSKTPDIPSKYSTTVDCNRTCTWAILEDIYTGFRYVHMNCHLDWMDMSVNQVQIKMIAEQITYFENLGYPVFATGDYNADEGCESYKIITAYENIADPKFIAEKTMDLGTYPDYDTYDVNVEKPIDYCFVTKNLINKVLEYRVITDKYKGNYVSDHFGIMVEAEVKALGKVDETLSLPSFDDNGLVANFDGKNINISFDPAKDSTGKVAKRYVVSIAVEGSNSAYEKKLWGKMHSLEPQKVLTVKYTPKTTNIFVVKVTPYDMFDNEGETIEIKVDCQKPAETDDGKTPVADIFDLGFTGTDVFDKSSSGLKITKYGKPTINGDSISFNKSSNLNMKTFSEHIEGLNGGFSQEIKFSVSDVNTEQGLFACMHAGGFGYYVDSGKLLFYLRIDDAYVILEHGILADTTYHAIATYDGATVTLYVDGQEVDSKSAEGSFTLPTDEKAKFLCLGADSDASGNGENRSSATIYIARLYSSFILNSKISKMFL